MMRRFCLCFAILLVVAGMARIVKAQGVTEAIVTTSDGGPPVTSPETINPSACRRLPPTQEAQLTGAEIEVEAAEPLPETIEQAWAIAISADRQLRAKWQELSSREQSLLLASAERHPLLAVNGAYTVRDNEAAFEFDLAGLPLPTNVFPYIQAEDFAFQTRVDLPLYTSGRIAHGIDAAEAQRHSAELQVDIFQSDLKLRVAEAFVAVLRAQRDVEVARSNVRSLDSHLRDVEMLYLNDRAPKNDLLAAKVAFSNALQREIQTVNRLDASRAAYNRRLGRSLTAPFELAELQPTEASEDLETLTLRAVSVRPEMASLAAQAQALQQRSEAVRAANRPQIGLHGQYAFQENRYQTPQGIASVGVGLSWNALDGGRRKYESGALREQAGALLRLREDLESRIRLEVRRAWLDAQEARKRIEVTREAIEHADENLRITRESYSLGSATSTDVLEAIRRRAETNRNHYRAVYDSVLATMRLRRAVWEL